MSAKKCRICGEEKPLEEFYSYKSYRHSYCHPCRKVYARNHNEKKRMSESLEKEGRGKRKPPSVEEYGRPGHRSPEQLANWNRFVDEIFERSSKDRIDRWETHYEELENREKVYVTQRQKKMLKKKPIEPKE